MPFGQDRIVPIYLATLAVRQQSPIRFRTAAEMLEKYMRAFALRFGELVF
jgi:hypothetical protein